jgi:hypothetical protein
MRFIDLFSQRLRGELVPIPMPMQLEYSLVVRHPDRFADGGVVCHSS